MVTRVQLDKIGSRIEQLASLINPGAGAITVAVFAGETPEFALQRHCELRPEHRGRPTRYDFRSTKRDELHELSAVWAGATQADFEEFWRALDENSIADRDGRELVSEFGNAA